MLYLREKQRNIFLLLFFREGLEIGNYIVAWCIDILLSPLHKSVSCLSDCQIQAIIVYHLFIIVVVFNMFYLLDQNTLFLEVTAVSFYRFITLIAWMQVSHQHCTSVF